MSIALRYVDRAGEIRVRFAGAVLVEDTNSETLFQHLLSFILNFGLDLVNLRGQAFYSTSNPSVEFFYASLPIRTCGAKKYCHRIRYGGGLYPPDQ